MTATLPETGTAELEQCLDHRFCHLFNGTVHDETSASCVDTSLCGLVPLSAVYPGHPMKRYDGEQRCVCGNTICPDCRERAKPRGELVPLPDAS